MDDNPYQSPKSAPEVEKRPARPVRRYSYAAFYGNIVFVGLVLSQATIMEFVWGQTDTFLSRADRRLMLLIYALIACPVGMLIAWWTWKVPESKWARVTAMLLGLSPLALLMFFMLCALSLYLLN